MSAPSNEVLLERLKSVEKQVVSLNKNFDDYKDSFVTKDEYKQYQKTIDAQLEPLKKLVWTATTAAIGGFIAAMYTVITS